MTEIPTPEQVEEMVRERRAKEEQDRRAEDERIVKHAVDHLNRWLKDVRDPGDWDRSRVNSWHLGLESKQFMGVNFHSAGFWLERVAPVFAAAGWKLTAVQHDTDDGYYAMIGLEPIKENAE